jgi:tetratricopeptide (TPR) repeat protein
MSHAAASRRPPTAQTAAATKARVLFSQGIAHHQGGRLTDARSLYRQVLQLVPRQADALHMLGVIEFQAKHYAEAVRLISDAKNIKPDNNLIHFNLGNALRALGQFPEAGEAFSKALQLRPDHLEALKNLGNVYKEQNRMAEAIACYDRLLTMAPGHPHTCYNKAIALLTEGQLAEGWDLYEYRLRCDTADGKHLGHAMARQAPDWNGRPPAKPLLVLPEQGLGDQIFYGAMLADLQSTGIESFVCLDGRLQALFARSFPGLDFVLPTDIDGLDPSQQLFGAQIQIGSLGRLFRRDNSDLARVPTPFLIADQDKTINLRSRIRHGKKLVCGISWSSKNADTGATKSISLQSLLPVLQVPDVAFVDLQYGDTTQERAEITAASGIKLNHLDDIDNKNDIDDLAALIQACDLVITVSNSTAHLAAALGKPTMILLAHHTPLWYWHLDSLISPWYPTATLLRQPAPGNWQPTIEMAASMLQGIADSV